MTTTKSLRPAAVRMARTMIYICLLLMTAAPAFARHGNPGSGGPGGPFADAPNREKLRKRVEMMIIWQVAEQMALPQETEKKLTDIIKTHFREKSAIVKKSFEIYKKLKDAQSGKTKPTEKQLKTLLGQLDKNHDDMNRCDDKFHDSLKKILTVEQQARFAVIWPQVQDDVRQFIDSKRREGMGQGKNAAPQKSK